MCPDAQVVVLRPIPPLTLELGEAQVLEKPYLRYSRRQASHVSRMADKTYAAQSAIGASYLLSVSGSSLLCTLAPFMPALLFSEPFSRALRRKVVGGFVGVIKTVEESKDSGGDQDLANTEE